MNLSSGQINGFIAIFEVTLELRFTVHVLCTTVAIPGVFREKILAQTGGTGAKFEGFFWLRRGFLPNTGPGRVFRRENS